MISKNIYVGTSGWSYKDWRGIIYPQEVKEKDFLKQYSEFLSVTEINSSFYHLPKAQTVLNWMKAVPGDFRFCPKLSQYITHYQRLRDCEDSLQRFFEIFSPMKEKMGPVLIQLPASVKFDPEVAVPFYSLLKKTYGDYEFALEGRHTSWFSDESTLLMKKYGISFVISHAGQRIPYFEAVTANSIYFRFHGPKELYASSYSDIMLRKYAEKFSEWKKEGHILWIFFNNTTGGIGFNNALKLKSILKV